MDPIDAALVTQVPLPGIWAMEAPISSLREALWCGLERDLDASERSEAEHRLLRAAIAAYLRAVEAQPVHATEDMPMDRYVAANMRKTWAGNLAAEVERQESDDA